MQASRAPPFQKLSSVGLCEDGRTCEKDRLSHRRSSVPGQHGNLCLLRAEGVGGKERKGIAGAWQSLSRGSLANWCRLSAM